MPLVTVLVDTYNHQSFIHEALCSVLSQDFPASDIEILVVDDGSTDNTPKIVENFLPRVRLLRKANNGQASAFNTGIPEARGEIIAFLDGDDWWAPNKVTAVVSAFLSNSGVGLVGHGVTQVRPDGRQRMETPRDISRFTIRSVEEARTFRMLRGFLGTSRMAYRREILDRIGPVPEMLKFEADEYLFTLAGLFADVMILREALTFYRLHEANLFQFSTWSVESNRKKQHILSDLAACLEDRLEQCEVPREIQRTILECVEVEADVLRLMVDSGFPWETITTEINIMRIFHRDSSMWQRLFSALRLIPATVLPARTYYRYRRRLTDLAIYQELRRKIMPFPVPNQVERRDKLAP